MEFQVGDKVVCVDNLGMENLLSLDEVSTVVSLQSNPRALHVSNGEGKIYAFSYRFKLVEDTKPSPNGVDAQGNAIYFDQTMLKPFMRVERKEGTFGIYVGEVNCDGPSVVGDFLNGCNWTSDFDMNECHGYDETIAIYEAPYDTPLYLDPNKKGNLIWRKTEPKTAEQLAQEAAVAARNKAIEEAENALKLAQERLEALKGM